MKMLNNIFTRMRGSIKTFLLLLAPIFLCSCDECRTYQEYYSDGAAGNCLLCGLFTTLTESASEVADTSWDTFASKLVVIVVLATTIYIAFHTLKMVASAGKQDAATYLMADKKGMIFLGFKMAVIVLLLQDTFFIDRIIAPVLQAGLEIGTALGGSGIQLSFSGSGGWSGLFSDINSAVGKYNDLIYETVATGQTMICVSSEGFILKWYWLVLLYGFIFFIFGWFTLAAVCFYIVDVLINLAFGAILLPFGIAFAISNQTSQYSTKIWQIFINAFFSFVILGVILGLSEELINLSLGRVDPSNITSMGENAFSASVVKTLDSNNIKELSEMLWASGSLLLTIVCFCLLVNLIEGFKDLVNKISDTASLTDSGTNTAAAEGERISKNAKRVGKYATDNAWSGAKYTGHVAARITRLDKGIDMARESLSSAQGTLTGTGRKGYKAFWRK